MDNLVFSGFQVGIGFFVSYYMISFSLNYIVVVIQKAQTRKAMKKAFEQQQAQNTESDKKLCLNCKQNERPANAMYCTPCSSKVFK